MAGWSYSLCGDEQDLVDVKSIQLSPDPPKPGSDLTVTASGFVKDTIEEGAYADVTVKMGLIKLLQKQFDICEEARNNNATLQCPVASDEYAIQQTVALPNEIPRAKFKIEVRAYTEDERSLLCLNLNIDFMQRPFFKAIGW
ncbi:hypothetical protein DL93DRAFT_696760 [Clavulina sp. PMI_390]|nr:hypothetical protein DL93DRAFT_696760 [Clavulina sp. PMI_390]